MVSSMFSLAILASIGVLASMLDISIVSTGPCPPTDDIVLCIEIGPSLCKPKILDALGLRKGRLTLRF